MELQRLVAASNSAMRRSIPVLIVLAMLSVACGVAPQGGADPISTTEAPSPTMTPSTSAEPGSMILPRCYESALPAADPSLYRDTPKYVGNEMPVDAVREWASQYPDFVDVWIDRDHNGWVAAGFTGDVSERQAELEEMFPGDGVVAIHLEWTEADLADLERRISTELGGVTELRGTSVDPLRGYVNVAIPVLDDESLAAIADRFPNERICVEGLEPENVVPPGQQPEAGEGWRLLYEEDEVGEIYRAGLAWDLESLAVLLADIPGLADIDLDADFENEIVIWFGAVHGSSCPNIRLDDVVVDGDTLHAVIVNTDNALACTDDAIPHTYLVGVERSRLPAPPFYLSLDGEPIGDRLQVDADLRDAGSGATGQVGAAPVEPEPDGSGLIIETGFPWEYTVDLSCGFEAIGEINWYHWVTEKAIPDAWLEASAGVEDVVVEVLLIEGPEPSLEVTFEGETVVYQPTDETGCP
jgi:hypothetical protein